MFGHPIDKAKIKKTSHIIVALTLILVHYLTLVVMPFTLKRGNAFKYQVKIKIHFPCIAVLNEKHQGA